MSSWQSSGIRSQPADPPTVKQGRPGLIVLTVVLVNLVIIAAVCNQAVSKHLQNYYLNHMATVRGLAVDSLLTFSWRFTPRSSDNQDGVHLLYSHLLTIGVFLVLAGLLTAAVVRGAVTFGRAFFGVWTAVLAAAVVGRAVGAVVTKPPVPNIDRATSAVFYSVGSTTVAVGVGFGLVSALIAGAVAVSSRRTVPVAGAAAAPLAPSGPPPESPPPYYGEQPATDSLPASGPDAGRHARPAADGQQVSADTDTQALPAEGADGAPADAAANDNRTQRLPRFDPSGGSGWNPPERGGEQR